MRIPGKLTMHLQYLVEYSMGQERRGKTKNRKKGKVSKEFKRWIKKINLENTNT